MSTAVVPNVRRLAQYRPFERGGLDLRAVLRDLVLAAAAIGDGAIESLLECRKAFADLWGLQVEVDELRPVLAELVDSGVAESAGKGIRLSTTEIATLEANAREWQDIEDEAYREWETSVRQARPGVSVEDMQILRTDLRQWLLLIIAWHGADAALMLYPEDERARRLFDDIDARGFEELPEREPALHALRIEVLPLFIRAPSAEQRRFLARLLNTSFYMTVLTIDPAAEQLVRAQMSGHRVYLDTNFLYAILGAAPPEEFYSSRRLVLLSRELGVEFAVTPWTMAELRTSIGRSRRDIDDQREFIRPELADTMLRSSGDKGFNRLFWQTYKTKKTQPKDVFDRLEHFDEDLAKYGIVEVAEGCTQIEQQQERIRLYASLVGAERWPYTKEPVVLEHDAKCRLLIERLRGEGHLSLSNARYWFLTYDSKLPRFAKRVPDNGDEVPGLPFCVSPSAWVQIIRALTPRTDDFDRTVVDLLTSPYVGYRRAVNASVVREVVGRMDHLEDASPELAIAILTDTAAVSTIEDAVSDEDDGRIGQTVEVAYSRKAKELQDAVVASEQRLAEIQSALAAAQTDAAQAEIRHTRERELAEQAQLRLQSERAEAAATELRRQREEAAEEQGRLEERLEQAARDRDDAAHRADQAEGRIGVIEARFASEDARHRRNWRIAAGTGVIALGGALALVLSLLIFAEAWAIGGAVIGGVALTLLGVRILAGKNLGGELVVWGSLLAALAAIVVAIIIDSN